MIDPRGAAPAKSGAVGLLWGLVVYAWSHLEGLGWQLERFEFSAFMSGLPEGWLALLFGGAAWWRSRPPRDVVGAPTPDATDQPGATTSSSAREALQRGRLPRVVPPRESAPSYFAPEEFECKGVRCGCTSPPMDRWLMRILNDVRETFGVTIVNSGYRCPEHNRDVGGATGSQHLHARAADIRAPGVEARHIYEYLYAKYPDRLGLGLYAERDFVHVDTRPGPAARWSDPALAVT